MREGGSERERREEGEGGKGEREEDGGAFAVVEGCQIREGDGEKEEEEATKRGGERMREGGRKGEGFLPVPE